MRQISVNNLIFLKSQNATFGEFLGHDQIEDHSGKRRTCPKALTPEIANCYLISARSTILSCHDASPGYNPYVNWRVPPVGFVFLSDNR
jgi:hypothetical protein